MPDNKQKEIDAIPTISYALLAHDKMLKNPDDKKLSEAYNASLGALVRNYGQDTAQKVMLLNSKLQGRGDNDIHKSLQAISKSSLAGNTSNSYMKTYFAMYNENPDLLERYQNAFDMEDKPKEAWANGLTASIEKHGEHEVIVPHKADIPFNIVIDGDKRKVLPKGVQANTVDVSTLPDLHLTDYSKNVAAINNQ